MGGMDDERGYLEDTEDKDQEGDGDFEMEVKIRKTTRFSCLILYIYKTILPVDDRGKSTPNLTTSYTYPILQSIL